MLRRRALAECSTLRRKMLHIGVVLDFVYRYRVIAFNILYAKLQ